MLPVVGGVPAFGRSLDEFRLGVGEILGLSVGLLRLLVAGSDLFEEVVELYLLGFGGELGVHRLGEQARVLLYVLVNVEVLHGCEGFPRVVEVAARLLEGVLGLGDAVPLRRGVFTRLYLLLDVRVGVAGLLEELVVLGYRLVCLDDGLVGLLAGGLPEHVRAPPEEERRERDYDDERATVYYVCHEPGKFTVFRASCAALLPGDPQARAGPALQAPRGGRSHAALAGGLGDPGVRRSPRHALRAGRAPEGEGGAHGEGRDAERERPQSRRAGEERGRGRPRRPPRLVCGVRWRG